MNNTPILDCHVHYALPISRDTLSKTLADTGTDMANLVIVPHRYRISSTPDALAFKHANPKKIYVFTGLDVSEYMRHPKKVGVKMKRFVSRMLRAGCDGVKMIEGKPDMRRTMPIPDFDKPEWEPFWAWAEKTGLPILWHVNDPEEFWDPDRIPDFAKKSGWFYGPDTINNEEQYRQVLAVLDRHPKLKIVFAHMFFLSAQLDRLCDYMRRYPNICVDLTPGIELYINLSKNPAGAQAFFDEFGNRILYGTDIGARAVISENKINDRESAQRVAVCRGFLEREGRFTVEVDGNFLLGDEDFDLCGMHLPDDMLQKIYHDNFVRLVGSAPRPVSRRDILRECRRLRVLMNVMRYVDKDYVPDFSAVDDVVAYFKDNK